jgi:DNA polymerase-3 subunit delta'
MSGVEETDRENGAPHPRATHHFVGHELAEQALADALRSGRLHHAWLIAGPRGVGKATLAYRAARVALGARPYGPRPLDVDPDDSVARRIAMGAHPDMFVLRRGLNDRGKPRQEITADEARQLGAFFQLKPAEGGYRVAIVDTVDDLNRNAANAILKTLEEPPPRCLLLLVCNAPGATLPTILSRCRRLALRPLSQEQAAEAATLAGFDGQAVAALARGSPGRAVALAGGDGAAIGDALGKAWDRATREGASALLSLIFEHGADKPERRALLFSLLRDLIRDEAVGSLARSGPVEAARWAGLYAETLEIEQESDGLDMDGATTVARLAKLIGKAAA